jgi:hypothetical protein
MQRVWREGSALAYKYVAYARLWGLLGEPVRWPATLQNIRSEPLRGSEAEIECSPDETNQVTQPRASTGGQENPVRPSSNSSVCFERRS